MSSEEMAKAKKEKRSKLSGCVASCVADLVWLSQLSVEEQLVTQYLRCLQTIPAYSKQKPAGGTTWHTRYANIGRPWLVPLSLSGALAGNPEQSGRLIRCAQRSGSCLAPAENQKTPLATDTIHLS